MTVNPYDKAYELVKAVRASDAFTRLKSARERIEQDSAALNMLQDFRRRQWELQRNELSGRPISETERSTLEKLAEVVALNQDVRAYLEAERQLTQVLLDIHQIIGEAVDEAMLPSPSWSSEDSATPQ